MAIYAAPSPPPMYWQGLPSICWWGRSICRQSGHQKLGGLKELILQFYNYFITHQIHFHSIIIANRWRIIYPRLGKYSRYYSFLCRGRGGTIMVMLRETSCRNECSFPIYYYYYYYSQLNPRLWKYIDVWNQYFMWHYIIF